MASGPLTLVGVGAGGIEELSGALDNSTVAWALIRVEVGQGTFARKKMIAISCVGSASPVVLRAKLVQRSSDAMALFESTHAQLTVNDAAECTVDWVLEQVLPVFAADNMGDFSAASFRAEYEHSVRKAIVKRRFAKIKAGMHAVMAFRLALPKREAAASAVTEGDDEEAAEAPEEAAATEEAAAEEKPQPPLERVFTTTQLLEAMKEVADQRGRFNWAILEPNKLDLHNAGCGGLEEMKEYFDMDKVMFGVLRLSFGKDPPVTKHVFIHWIGPDTGTVKRGRWNDKVFKAKDHVKEFVTLNQAVQAFEKNDLDLDDIVAEIKRTTYDAKDVDEGVGHQDVVKKNMHKQKELEIQEEYYLSVAADMKRAASDAKKAEEEAAAAAKAAEEAAAAEAPPQEGDEPPQEEEEEEKEPEEIELPPLEEAIRVVTERGGYFNWALIQVGS